MKDKEIERGRERERKKKKEREKRIRLEEEEMNHAIFNEENIPEELQEIDQTFRCSICGSLFDKAVSIKDCGHTYCSVCIRSHWKAVMHGIHRQPKSCPICRTILVNQHDINSALVINRSVQESVKVFREMLQKKNNADDQEVLPLPSSLPRSRRPRRAAAAADRRKVNNNNHDDDDYEEEKDDDNDNDDDRDLPIHENMASRNYGKMKKKELQKMLKDFSLPSSGSEQDLTNRIRRFQSMWNAEVDSIHPSRPSEVAKKLIQEEQAQKDEKKRSMLAGSSNDTEYIKNLKESIGRKNGSNEAVTSGNTNFDNKLDGKFHKLEVELRNRSKGKSSSSAPTTKPIITCEGSKGNSTGTVSAESHAECIEIDMEETSTGIEEESEDILSENIQQTIATTMNKENDSVSSTKSRRRNLTIHNQKTTSSQTAAASSSSSVSPRKSRQQSRSKKTQQQKITVSKVKRSRSSPLSKASASPSPSVATRLTWSCTRCTFENTFPSYLCAMCSNRRTEN